MDKDKYTKQIMNCGKRRLDITINLTDIKHRGEYYEQLHNIWQFNFLKGTTSKTDTRNRKYSLKITLPLFPD